jgi:biopolymer transport protein TolR
MAMTASERDDPGVVPQMNVTPLVDVVLVLLIIFMVITPLLSKTFWIHTPVQEQEEAAVRESDPTQPLVLQIGPDRTLQINGSAITYDELPERLRRIFAARSDHVLFFDADDHAPYGFVVQVMDQAREGGGAVTIAALTEHLSPQAAAPQG